MWVVCTYMSTHVCLHSRIQYRMYAQKDIIICVRRMSTATKKKYWTFVKVWYILSMKWSQTKACTWPTKTMCSASMSCAAIQKQNQTLGVIFSFLLSYLNYKHVHFTMVSWNIFTLKKNISFLFCLLNPVLLWMVLMSFGLVDFLCDQVLGILSTIGHILKW